MGLLKKTFKNHSQKFTILDSDEIIEGLVMKKSLYFLLPFIPKEGMVLRSVITGADFYLHGTPSAVPDGLHGPVIAYKINFLSKNEYDKLHNSSSTFNIGNINGPSIVGNQTNATMNIGSSIEDLEKLISNKATEDQEELNKLVKLLETITDNNMPLSKGTLAKFSDILAKHQDIVIAVGGFLTTFFMSK
ncbi:hypothetical protein HMPREF0402_02488 [Fusobacterium ulcerans 12-1B]|uniref:Uncharacterized protein n=1 Tax=Fusobacterium ulcerans 12-1B TaxID=457404 RepID=H1PVP5_9FUSO|nr:hypothetical protein HMPREF0402_02488 [Fusobacterium ulcerans 12-1B]